jgi:ubiquitin C-terminal hydrolase
MDRIESFLKQTSHSDILQKTFQGHLSNQLNCEGCPHRSDKIEPFTSIGVNLKNKKTL